MLQITPQMRIFVAIEAVDFRNGIDGLVRLCKEVLEQDPFRGGVFVFRNRYTTASSPRPSDCAANRSRASGHEEGGRRFVRWCQGRMRRRISSKVDAEDLAQEALLHAWQGFENLDSLLIEQYRNWLRLICKNCLADAHRHYARALCRAVDREQPLDDQGMASGLAAGVHATAADARLCAAEMQGRLDRALAALPANERDAFVSHGLRGESFDHIAQRQDCSRNTALAAYRRARHRLATDLAEV